MNEFTLILNISQLKFKMFAFEIVEECVTLTFTDNNFSVSFSPEDIEHIMNIDIGDSGKFDSCPWNGECSLQWNSEKFIFNVAKFGDGKGGSLTITVPNTPELMKSFRSSIEQWKTSLGNLEVELN